MRILSNLYATYYPCRENFLSTSRVYPVSSHVEAPACRNQGGADGRRLAVLHETGWMRGRGDGGGGTRCPKGVFRNRGKMEENRYSLVAGKSRVERAERGRKGGV